MPKLKSLKTFFSLWRFRLSFISNQAKFAMAVRATDLTDEGAFRPPSVKVSDRSLTLQISVGLQASERQKIVSPIQIFTHPVGTAESCTFQSLALLLSEEKQLIEKVPREIDGVIRTAFVLALEELATNENLKKNISSYVKREIADSSISFFMDIDKPVFGSFLNCVKVFVSLTETSV